jgi:hypothetical protein
MTKPLPGKPDHASTYQVSAWATPADILASVKESHIAQIQGEEQSTIPREIWERK